MRASRHVIVTYDVVRVRDPERGWCDVIIKQTGARSDKERQIVLQHVSGFDAVLQKEGAAHDVIDDRVLHQHVMRVMDVDGAVKRAVDGTATHVRSRQVAVQVEMHRVAPQTEGLPRVRDLDVRHPRRHDPGVKRGLVDHDGGAELVAPDLLPELTLETRLLHEHSCQSNINGIWFYIISCFILFTKSEPCRVGLVVSVSASHTVGREFASRPGHTKDHHKNSTDCLPVWHAMR